MVRMNTMRTFFDGHAPHWDGYQRPSDFEQVGRIIDRVAPGPADQVLDVGCGTGILVPFLEAKGVRRYLGMDISPGMAAQFRRKHAHRDLLVGDFTEENLRPGSFTLVIVFNAFPHFDDGERVFARSFQLLRPGGRLVVAHSMNREQLDEHHRKAGRAVENHVLIADAELRRLYKQAGFVDVTVENTDHFYSCGRRPPAASSAARRSTRPGLRPRQAE